ncbi:MAG TPA: mechanosensitive ion channel family protein [Candidatus Udaeobacter sp.]|nr:mechanosensitive ion channel family protein [Candidatus Udaeobacter sp.]
MIFDQPLLLASLIGAVGLASTAWLFRQPTKTRLAVGIAYMAVFSLVLLHGGVSPLRPPPAAMQGNPRLAFQLLEIFWWFWLARLLITLGRAFLLIDHREQERKFATDLLAGVVYIGFCFAVAGLVLDLAVTGLLATSGVIAIVLGLALQSTLGDLFSGIALNIEGPYHVGDWIALEGGAEGQVIEINWRATHIMTTTRESIIVPNSNIAKSRIVNFSSPTATQGVEFTVSLDNRTPPSRGIELIQHAVLNCRNVLTEPGPKIRVKDFAASSVTYQVRFFVRSVDLTGQVKSDVLNFIYRHARWAGISIAVPQAGEEPVLRIAAGQSPAAARLVDRAPQFVHLLPSERDAVQKALTSRAMRAGEVLLKQNSEVESLFFIDSGVVSLTKEQEDGTTVEVDRRGPGDDIGALALLSGKPSGVTVRALTTGAVYELRRPVILSLLQARPELKAELDHALATRSLLPSNGRDADPPDPRADVGIAEKFFERIGAFFVKRDAE